MIRIEDIPKRKRDAWSAALVAGKGVRLSALEAGLTREECEALLWAK